MANPQKENGYTAIANEIMDALARIRIAGEHRQVLDVILRKTYGYQKKEDAIALSQFHEKTGIKKPSICRALKALLKMKIISEKANNSVAKIYCFNKDFDEWVPLAKKLTISEKANKSLPKSEEKLAKKLTTKEINKKKRIHAEIFSADPVSKKQSEIKYYGDPTPMFLEEFVSWCKKSMNRHIQIVGEWAEAEKFDYKTKGQWRSLIRRNVRAAKNLIAFSNEELQTAYEKMLADVVSKDPDTGRRKGFITKYTLETLSKYI